MSRRFITTSLLLLSLTAHTRSQFADFFSGSFYPQYQTERTRPRYDVTKRPETKPKQTARPQYDGSIIVFDKEDYLRAKYETIKPINPYSFDSYTTTIKPRRKTTTTSPSNNDDRSNSRNSNPRLIASIYNAQVDNLDANSRPTSSNKEINNINKYENVRKITNTNVNDDYNNRETTSNNYKNFDKTNKITTKNNRGTEGHETNIGGSINYDSNTRRTPGNSRGLTDMNRGITVNNREINKWGTTINNYKNLENTNKITTTNNRGTEGYGLNIAGSVNYDSNTRRTPGNSRGIADINKGVTDSNRGINNWGTTNNRGTTTTNTWGNAVTSNPRPGQAINSFTTVNPLLHRPGVKPAAVDDSRPPMTNKPDTDRFDVFPKPKDPGSITFISEPIEPDIEMGPDEDAMSSAEKMRYIELAEQACDEYKSLIVKKLVALPLVLSGQGGDRNVSCTPPTVPLIINGVTTSIKDYPHMALVGWTKIQNRGYSWKCGGSLISDRYVLTAGHCTYQNKDDMVISGPPTAVQLGSSYLDDPEAQVMKILSIIRHPKYKLSRSYHDVALLKLTRTVKFSNTIRPACLGVPPPTGRPIVATGWGRTEFGGDSSFILRSVSILVWDMRDCQNIWGTSLRLPEGPRSDNHVCAGEKGGGKDTCQGDSGGPAQVQEGCSWRVVAVTSVGRSCGAADTPALYATIPRAFVAKQVFGDRKLTPRSGNTQQNGYSSGNTQQNGYSSGNTQQNGYKSGNNQQNSYGIVNTQPDGYRSGNTQQNGYSSGNTQQNGYETGNTQQDGYSSGNTQNNGYSSGNTQNNGLGSASTQRNVYGSESIQQNVAYGNTQQNGNRNVNTRRNVDDISDYEDAYSNYGYNTNGRQNSPSVVGNWWST